MGDLAEQHAALESEGIGLAAISVDSPEDSAALATRLGVEFPLLSDPDARVIESYGVKMEGESLAVPATFVVRPDRTIAWEYVGDTVPDRPPVEVVREEARRSR
ncbi:MAG: peroxiredoxin family protein [Myxococcales bacterium]|nr:peroxiredoxin family protein [Myxococcales bacterium]MCB9716479.1 peroxiredoxin family protein [Myxococcales bacterium]